MRIRPEPLSTSVMTRSPADSGATSSAHRLNEHVAHLRLAASTGAAAMHSTPIHEPGTRGSGVPDIYAGRRDCTRKHESESAAGAAVTPRLPPHFGGRQHTYIAPRERFVAPAVGR